MGRVVLVTGGNRGIGLAVAQAFVAAGDRVAITARSGELPAELEGSDVLVVKADVTDSATVDAAFDTVEKELGPVEVVVANAGITRDTLILRMSDDDIDAVIDTNLVGCIRVAPESARAMPFLPRMIAGMPASRPQQAIEMMPRISAAVPLPLFGAA